jgi:ketosteroid isomerase-like protein
MKSGSARARGPNFTPILPRPCATLVAIAFAWLLPLGATAAAQEQPAVSRQQDENAIRPVVEGFHDALSAGDSTGALTYLHDDLIVYEAGHAETLEEYRSGHLASDMAFSRSVVFATERDTVVPGRELSLYFREYSMKGNYRDNEIDAHGVESIVLALTDKGWKIRHIHWSSR